MKLNSLISYLHFFTCIYATLPPVMQLKLGNSLRGASRAAPDAAHIQQGGYTGHLMNELNPQQMYNPNKRLRTGYGPADAKHLQLESYVGQANDIVNPAGLVARNNPEMNQLPLKGAIGTNAWKDLFDPLDLPISQKQLDALLSHNAHVDNQFALREWIRMSPSPKKKVIIQILLENKSINFGKLNRHIAFNRVISSGNLEDFKLLQMLYPKPRTAFGGINDGGLTALNDVYEHIGRASRLGQLDILKYLIDDYKIPGNLIRVSSDMAVDAAKSGNLDVLRYLIDDKKLRINYNDIMKGAFSGKGLETDYIIQVLKYLHEEKGVPIPQNVGHYPPYVQNYYKSIKSKGTTPDDPFIVE